MFVQSERFVEAHEGRLGDIAIHGQESNHTTWRSCRMNLAVRGIDADIRWNSEGRFHKDELPDLRDATEAYRTPDPAEAVAIVRNKRKADLLGV